MQHCSPAIQNMVTLSKSLQLQGDIVPGSLNPSCRGLGPWPLLVASSWTQLGDSLQTLCTQSQKQTSVLMNNNSNNNTILHNKNNNAKLSSLSYWYIWQLTWKACRQLERRSSCCLVWWLASEADNNKSEINTTKTYQFHTETTLVWMVDRWPRRVSYERDSIHG